MLKSSLIMKGAIASVVVGALTYYFFVHRRRKAVSVVDRLAHSDTKTSKDMVDQLISMNTFLLPPKQINLKCCLLELGIIKDKRVYETMLKVDRVHYVPPHHPNPYKEGAVPIGIIKLI